MDGWMDGWMIYDRCCLFVCLLLLGLNDPEDDWAGSLFSDTILQVASYCSVV